MSDEKDDVKPSLKVVKFEPKKGAAPAKEEAEKPEDLLVAECDKILTNAMGQLSTVLIVGYTKGEEYEYFATSTDDNAEVLWLLERMKYYTLASSDSE